MVHAIAIALTLAGALAVALAIAKSIALVIFIALAITKGLATKGQTPGQAWSTNSHNPYPDPNSNRLKDLRLKPFSS